MGVIRGMGGLIGGVVLVVALVPVLALGPGGVVGRGAGGEVRGTWFHLGLTLSDPYVWESVRNSVAAAGVVAAGSLVLGVALARGTGRRRFWGRGLVAALGLA